MEKEKLWLYKHSKVVEERRAYKVNCEWFKTPDGNTRRSGTDASPLDPTPSVSAASVLDVGDPTGFTNWAEYL